MRWLDHAKDIAETIALICGGAYVPGEATELAAYCSVPKVQLQVHGLPSRVCCIISCNLSLNPDALPPALTRRPRGAG